MPATLIIPQGDILECSATVGVLRHAVEGLVRGGVSRFAVAIPAGADAFARDCLEGIDGVTLVTGGASRQESVARALEICMEPEGTMTNKGWYDEILGNV